MSREMCGIAGIFCYRSDWRPENETLFKNSEIKVIWVYDLILSWGSILAE